MTEKELRAIAKALADPRRFEMLRLIAAKGTASCAELKEHFPVTAATLSHHMKELEGADLITSERDGKFVNAVFQRKTWRAYLRELRSF